MNDEVRVTYDAECEGCVKSNFKFSDFGLPAFFKGKI